MLHWSHPFSARKHHIKLSFSGRVGCSQNTSHHPCIYASHSYIWALSPLFSSLLSIMLSLKNIFSQPSCVHAHAHFSARLQIRLSFTPASSGSQHLQYELYNSTPHGRAVPSFSNNHTSPASVPAARAQANNACRLCVTVIVYGALSPLPPRRDGFVYLFVDLLTRGKLQPGGL